MNKRNTPSILELNTSPEERLYDVDENSVVTSRFISLVGELFHTFEATFPDTHVGDQISWNIAKDVVEIWILLGIFDESIQTSDFNDIGTFFSILNTLYVNGFFEDTVSLQKNIFSLLQKYNSIISWDSSSLQSIQDIYKDKLLGAKYSSEIEYIHGFCIPEIEYFLDTFSSQEDFQWQRTRYRNLLTTLSQKEIISSSEYAIYWNETDIKSFYELLFCLLEKNIWPPESSLKQRVGITLREYFHKIDSGKFSALWDYEPYEQQIEKYSSRMLEVLITKKVQESSWEIDDFLTYLLQAQTLTEEEFQNYISSKDIVHSICEIMSTKIILGKDLNEESELEEKWLIFLISYYWASEDQSRVKELQMYWYINAYDLILPGFGYIPVFQTEVFHIDSQNFHHFLNIAMDLPDRIKNSKKRDFFEWERELMAIFQRFQETSYISEDQFHEFQDTSYEMSVYRLLKHIYLEWFFSGNIQEVEKIRDVLLAISQLISPDDMIEISEYFMVRYTQLITKERKKQIIPFCQQIFESLKEWNEKEEENMVWDLVSLLERYDTSWNMSLLHQYRNNPRIIAMECLHFSIIEGFLNLESSLLSELYHYVKWYYTSKNIWKRVVELNTFLETLENTSPEILEDIIQTQTREIVSGVTRILSSLELWFYEKYGKQKEEDLEHSLFLQWIIDENEREIISRVKNPMARFYNLFSFLELKWYFDMHQNIISRIQQTKKVSEALLSEQENWGEEDEIIDYTLEQRWAMVRSNTLQLIDWIKDNEINTLPDEYFFEFHGFLSVILQWDSSYSEIFGEEASDILNIADKEERAHGILLLVFCDFLDDDFDTMQEVFSCLKEYYSQNSDVCEILENIIHPHRVLNWSPKQ